MLLKKSYLRYFYFATLFLIIFCLSSNLHAQRRKAGKELSAKVNAKADTTKMKTVEELTKPCRAIPGLFSLFQDTTNGKLYMLVMEEQLEKEYIYFSYVENGVLASGFFRGAYRGSRIFTMRRYFDKLEFLLENTSYYFDPESPLSRSANTGINKPTLASRKIVAKNPDGDGFLIEADALFLNESMQQIKRSPRPGVKEPKGFVLGNLSKDKNKYVDIRNYPRNTDIIAEFVYENPYPIYGGGKAVTDPRYVAVKIQHSLIELPQNDFEPRMDDPRVGYFMHQVNDMTSLASRPYRDVIHRWDLQKKNPGPGISEVVEPIVWWIENTTPIEFREIIRDGVMQWNKAFEKAGFKNAVVVKLQADDATWDAGDIRYNVLRWTSSPQPPFGGYGPSFVNPRTGQILGADIMLELVSVSNRLRREKVFESAGLRNDDINGRDAQDLHGSYRCEAGDYAQQAMLFGLTSMHLGGFSEMEKSEMIRQSLYRLVLHEVGHTLGLNHNFRGSNLRKLSEVHDKAIGEEKGLCSSVMEYPSINFSPFKDRQGLYYDVKPGPYDDWAIDFGYSEAQPDPKAEGLRIENILSKSADPSLAFGNDADDMRSAGKGIDPRIMIYDLSDDPVGYALQRIKLVNELMPGIKTKYSREGDSYHDLRMAYLILTGETATQLRIISRQIAGIYLDRSFVGQKGGGQPFTPVPREKQVDAMKALAEHAFGKQAFSVPASLIPYLQVQRRGFNHGGANEDPKIHSRILNIQKDLLNQLLHVNVLRRLTDSELYGNTYKLGDMMSELSVAVFKEDLRSTVKTIRQNLQIEYVNRLIQMMSPGNPGKYDHLSISMALYQLKTIKGWMKSASKPDISTQAHRERITFDIEHAFDQNQAFKR